MRLLDKRRDLRGQEGGEFETVQIMLNEVSSLLKEAREKVTEQRTAELEEEMSEICIAARAESGVREKRKGSKKTMLLLATHSLGPRGLD